MITIYLQTYGECPVREKHKTEHRIGLTLLSRGLSELYGIDIPAEEIEEHLGHGEQQKPCLPEYPQIFFNISHCDGLVICGFADGPVGVDVEKIGTVREPVLRKLLTGPEREFLESLRENPEKFNEYFYRFWTLKESRIKQCGLGLAMPLTDFSFTFTQTSGSEPEISCSEPNLYFCQRIVLNDYVLAVCTDRTTGEIEYRFPKSDLR